MNSGDEQKALERRPIFWFYGSSSIAYGIKDNAFSYLLLTFANQALGVPGYLASLALAIAIVWDALTDPLLGHWSDKTQSKLGRRHPLCTLLCSFCQRVSMRCSIR
jgi:Na+/melibiose symporter-like transporter